MNRKTLSLPLISALVASAAIPAEAQVALELSSQKSYRQDENSIDFKGGRFSINFRDGSVSSVGGCNWFQYYPPGYFRGLCAEGTTAYLTSGTVDGKEVGLPYLLVTGVNPAIAVEPRKPELVLLKAAPASLLPRPSGGFADSSVALYYNLHTTNIREYVLTRYNTSRQYTAKQRGKFEQEIVPGVYHYSFPRLRNPNQPAPITAVIYPMAEGLATLNNREEGFEFTDVNGSRWTKNGFIELSYRRPNIVNWKGLSPNVVFAAVDDLYFSLKGMQDPTNPDSEVVGGNVSVFPAFSAPSDARVELPTPYVSTYTLPPIFNSGTRALITLDLQRGFQTGGVTYDFSSRKFQVPVVVLDRYTEYEEIVFDGKGGKIDILDDTDKDGYNNLNEWILDSDASVAGSVPIPPRPVLVEEFFDPFFGALGQTYFGFTIDKKLGTIPKVSYLLQRSRNNGRSWEKFVSDENWDVTNVRYTAGGALRSEIRVRSKVVAEVGFPITYIQPPGTEGDIYRVKITLRK